MHLSSHRLLFYCLWFISWRSAATLKPTQECASTNVYKRKLRLPREVTCTYFARLLFERCELRETYTRWFLITYNTCKVRIVLLKWSYVIDMEGRLCLSYWRIMTTEETASGAGRVIYAHWAFLLVPLTTWNSFWTASFWGFTALWLILFSSGITLRRRVVGSRRFEEFYCLHQGSRGRHIYRDPLKIKATQVFRNVGTDNQATQGIPEEMHPRYLDVTREMYG
jgi:hypothetical protein